MSICWSWAGGPGEKVAVAQAGLGGQEDPVPGAAHPRVQPQLGVAVAGGDVEVVDPGVQGQLDRGVSGVLVDRRQGGRAVDQDRAPVAGATQSALLHGHPLLVPRRPGPHLAGSDPVRAAVPGYPSTSPVPGCGNRLWLPADLELDRGQRDHHRRDQYRERDVDP